MAVHLRSSTGRIVVVNAHVPHSGRPPEDMTQACNSLGALVGEHTKKHRPVVLLGDFNVAPHSNTPGARACQVSAARELAGVTLLESRPCPTWHDRCYDHILCNKHFDELTLALCTHCSIGTTTKSELMSSMRLRLARSGFC